MPQQDFLPVLVELLQKTKTKTNSFRLSFQQALVHTTLKGITFGRTPHRTANTASLLQPVSLHVPCPHKSLGAVELLVVEAQNLIFKIQLS